MAAAYALAIGRQPLRPPAHVDLVEPGRHDWEPCGQYPGGRPPPPAIWDDDRMDFPVYVPGYAVEHQLDVGGDGSAWVAREEATGRRVALKLLPVHDPVARERARRDAATLTAIDHPHVVPVLGVADSPGAVVLVLALADGGSLA